MITPELQSRIEEFPRWHYEIELGGVKTPIFDSRFANRHRQRKKYFFDPLVKLFGGSLHGKRVLDLGCNAGFWSLCAIDAGCDFVLGIDGRAMHVEQAELVFEARGIDPSRYEFRCANFFDVLGEDLGSFDVVLCLGILYHTCKPFTLLEGISKLNSDVLMIDTGLSLQQGAILECYQEPLEEPRSACDYELVMFPSRAAVQLMVQQLGYRSVTLRPDFTSYVGAEDYQRGERRAFFCFKRDEVDGLDVESSPPLPTSSDPNLMNASTARLFKTLLSRLFSG